MRVSIATAIAIIAAVVIITIIITINYQIFLWANFKFDKSD